MLRLLILGGLAAGAFFAWKKFMSAGELDDELDDMYGSAKIHQASDAQGATPA
jgi:hypothetical protein